jgi:CRISPR/Cas system-associated exonuclease Cas4 (RecB family)
MTTTLRPEPVSVLAPFIDQIEFAIPPEDQLPPAKNYTPRRVSASGIARCSREWYYTLDAASHVLGEPVRKREWDIAAAHGTIIHDQIQRALIEYGLVKAPEAYLPNRGLFLGGRTDGELTAEPALLEIKSVNEKSWRQFPDSDKFRHYQDQIQIYLHVLDLPKALLVCVRREPILAGTARRKSLCKEFWIPRDRRRGEELAEKTRWIEKHLTNGVVPPAEPGDGCFFCAYQRICAAQDIEDSLQEGE